MTLLEVVVSMLLLAIIVAGVSATFALVGKGPGKLGILELQGLNYARESLEKLKEAVSTGTAQGGHGAPLVDSNPNPKIGTIYQDKLPGRDFKKKHGAGREYEVNDVDMDNDGAVDYKRVTVTVKWND